MISSTEKFRYRTSGSSRDGRTNVWTVTCLKCNKEHRPDTTMMAYQTITCPTKSCDNSEIINYNALKNDT